MAAEQLAEVQDGKAAIERDLTTLMSTLSRQIAIKEEKSGSLSECLQQYRENRAARAVESKLTEILEIPRCLNI
jgi:hypothetical protein